MIPMDETREAMLMDATPNQAGQINEVMDAMDAIMLIDCGDPDEAQYTAAFQVLIDAGIVWKMQGSYARMARSLIAHGYCHK